MFTKKVSDSDAFIEMSSAAQALYFHLNQGADDDGFNNQIQIAMLKAHASTDDLKILMAKNFIIRFESGVIVIKHWRMHNTLRKDRYTPTSFQGELKQLGIKVNGAYTLDFSDEETRLPFGCQMDATDKYSIEKDSKDKKSKGEGTRATHPTIEEVKAYCEERNNGIDAEKWFDFYSSKGWKVGKSPMVDWKAAVRTWERRERKEGGNNGGSTKYSRHTDYDKYTDET